LLYNSEAEHRADVNEVQTGTLWLTVVADRCTGPTMLI
jgi:hypothetical protein